MPAAERLIGTTPRIKLLEALVRLGSQRVTRGELAREAGLFRTTTNRVLEGLVNDGIVKRVSEGKQPTFEASLESPELRLFSHFSTALSLLQGLELGTDTEHVTSLAISQMAGLLSTVSASIMNTESVLVTSDGPRTVSSSARNSTGWATTLATP